MARYTHRVAISNQRLVAADDGGVAFRWKDYRLDGPDRWKTMRLHPHEFIRRFLMHVLPKGFHRIRHYGLFANANRADNIARARELLNVPPPVKEADEDKPAADESQVLPCPCPRCGGRLIIIETFAEGTQPASWPQRWVPNPRDFVPWRFSDACCRCVGLRNLHIKPSHYLHINCREQVQQTTGRPRPTCGRVIPTFCSDYWHVLAPLRSSQ